MASNSDTGGKDSPSYMVQGARAAPDHAVSGQASLTRAPDKVDTIVHTEKGEVFCICPATGERRAMTFQGYETDRGTLKYRCPAAAYDLLCEGREACHAAAGCQAGSFGRVVRIKLSDRNRRIFTPTPIGSASWFRGYNRRSALERSRLDNDFGFEKHYIRGLGKMKTRVGLALAVALGQARAGREDRMRSLADAVPLAA